MTLLFAALQLCVVGLGLALGSFLAVHVVRFPERSVVTPASACPTCGTPLTWQENVPVVSWLVQGARCHTCETPISPLYPLLELLMGLVAWLVFQRFVPGPAQVDVPHLAAFALHLWFAWTLLVAAYTDLRTFLIPDVAGWVAVPVALLGVAGLQALGFDGWPWVGWEESVVASAVVLVVVGGSKAVLGLLTSRPTLGGGDLPLLMIVSAVLGLYPGLLLFLAWMCGLALVQIVVFRLAGHRSAYFPLAPPIAGAALLVLLWGDAMTTGLIGVPAEVFASLP